MRAALRARLPWVLCCLLVTQASRAAAQEPDSLATEADTVAVSDHFGAVLLFAGVFAAMLVAPPALLLGPLNPPDTVGDAWRNHLGVRVSGGLSLRDKDGDRAWGPNGGLSVEASLGGFYASSAFVRSWASPQLRLRAARVGYLWRPVPALAGGVTVGVSDAASTASLKGVEIGLPLVMTGPGAVMRLEAGYVIASGDGSYRWLFEGDYDVGWRGLRSGFGISVLPAPLSGGVVAAGFVHVGWWPIGGVR